MARVRVPGGEVEYEEYGSGAPIVFSHGGSSDLRYWQPQRETFSARYRYVAYSRRTRGDTSAAAHVADLCEICRRLGDPVHLVGFSSAVTLRAALAAPELLRTLVVLEPNVPWVIEGAGDAVLARWREANERVRSEAGGDREREAALWFELVNNRGAGAFALQPEPLRRMWRENFGREAPAPAPPEPLRCGDLRTIRTPTLALATERGMTYSRRIVARIAACIPECRLLVLPGATHFVSYQDPEHFNSVLLSFLAEHP